MPTLTALHYIIRLVERPPTITNLLLTFLSELSRLLRLPILISPAQLSHLVSMVTLIKGSIGPPLGMHSHIMEHQSYLRPPYYIITHHAVDLLYCCTSYLRPPGLGMPGLIEPRNAI